MAPRVLLIDNYDSFTWNLVDVMRVAGADVHVARNDAIDVATALAWAPSHVVLSPGPGRPEDAGVLLAMVDAFHGRRPLLGVCLGHQAIGAYFGGLVVRAAPVHGKPSRIRHDGRGVFVDQPPKPVVGRYHSLVVDATSLPAELEASAWTDDGLIMGLRHRSAPTEGVQFHPESIMSPTGPGMIRRFLSW